MTAAATHRGAQAIARAPLPAPHAPSVVINASDAAALERVTRAALTLRVAETVAEAAHEALDEAMRMAIRYGASAGRIAAVARVPVGHVHDVISR
jgi:hypothetical protein